MGLECCESIWRQVVGEFSTPDNDPEPSQPPALPPRIYEEEQSHAVPSGQGSGLVPPSAAASESRDLKLKVRKRKLAAKEGRKIAKLENAFANMGFEATDLAETAQTRLDAKSLARKSRKARMRKDLHQLRVSTSTDTATGFAPLPKPNVAGGTVFQSVHCDNRQQQALTDAYVTSVEMGLASLALQDADSDRVNNADLTLTNATDELMVNANQQQATTNDDEGLTKSESKGPGLKSTHRRNQRRRAQKKNDRDDRADQIALRKPKAKIQKGKNKSEKEALRKAKAKIQKETKTKELFAKPKPPFALSKKHV